MSHKKTTITFILSLIILTTLSSQWELNEFSNSKHFFSGTSNELFIVFAGGNTVGFMPNDDIDIYNVELDAWIQLKMSTPRADPAIAIHNEYLYIVGGVSLSNFEESDVIDIINLNTFEQRVEKLSQARHDVSILTSGNKIYFAGGSDISFAGKVNFCPFEIIDVLDLASNTWSMLSIPEPKAVGTAVSLNGKLYFFGGLSCDGQISNLVQIYDIEENIWITDSLSEARFYSTIAVHDDKIYIAGGNNSNNASSSRIDIFDTTNSTWSTDELALPRSILESVVVCDKIYFIGGSNFVLNSGSATESFNHVDVFDVTTSQWSMESINAPRTWFGAASSQNTIIIAGGWDPAGIGLVGTIETMACEEIVSTETRIESDLLEFYPNPSYSNESLIITSANKNLTGVSILDVTGRTLFAKNFNATNSYELNFHERLPTGALFMKVVFEDSNTEVRKVIRY